MYHVKDFICTKEGLVFAVVEKATEQDKVLCFLRYQWTGDSWRKLSTANAIHLLESEYPQYLYYSDIRDTYLHAVHEVEIAQHLQPRTELQRLCQTDAEDIVQADCQQLIQLLAAYGIDTQKIGMTGSLLLGAQNPQSDIDLVFYDRSAFMQARECIRLLIEQQKLHALGPTDWQASYARRLGALTVSEYIWHEQRKYNKALINGRKFDISLADSEIDETAVYEKTGTIRCQAQVINDNAAYDYPARLQINHDCIGEVLCYTATYIGQAQNGEIIDIAGQLEKSATGAQRIIVGSSREADGEYIKVVESIT